MLFSDADGHKVVSTTTAETIGKVHDYIVDPQGPSVAAVLLKKTDKGIGDTLRWADVVAFGADAVTVESSEKITAGGDDLAPLLEKRNHLHKKRVLSTVGDELGAVKDIDFDPSTGAIISLVLDDKVKTEITAARLIGVGSYAVVVEADTAPASGTANPPQSFEAPSAPQPSEAPPAPQPSEAPPSFEPAPRPSEAPPAPQSFQLPPAPPAAVEVPYEPVPPEPTSLDLTPPADHSEPIVLTPPDMSKTERASYPPAE